MTSLIPTDIAEIESWFSELSLGHSNYQIEHFIVGQYLTPDRKYKQCLLELNHRLNSLKSIEFDHKDLLLKIDLYEFKLSKLGALGLNPGEKIKAKRYRNKIEKTRYQISQLFQRAEGLVREMRCFIVLAEKEKARREYASFEESEEKYWTLKQREEKLPLLPT